MRAVAFVFAPSPDAARPFLGRPLVRWPLEAAARSGAIDRIVVVTDAPEVRAAVSGLPEVETIGTVGGDALRAYASRHEFDAAVFLGLAPLTRPEDVRNALDRYASTEADSLVSVARPRGAFWSEDGPWARPLDAAPLLENGAVAIASRRGFLDHGTRAFGRVAFYEMPPETQYDPDDPACRRAAFARESAARLRSIRLVLSDVDGVLTDAGMYYGEGGDELKKFNTRDGKGFEIVRNLGLKTGIVTTENTALVARRAKKLRVDYLHQGIERKHESLGEICAELGIAPAEVAYIGDDVNDLSILREVGFAACPADAVEEVKALAHHVCRAKGGEGAVRELCDLIATAHRI